MSETITACENVCRDFSWATDILEAILGLVPWFALIWAILAFFKKRADDRHAVNLDERRKIYLELVETVHSFRRKHVRGEEAGMWDYYMLLEKIRLVFPRKLPESITVHEHAIRYFGRTEQDDFERFDNMREAEEHAFDRLLLDLRRDLEIPVSGDKQ